MKEILGWGAIINITLILCKIVKFVAVSCVIGLFVWLIWNWLVTAAFSLPALDYVQVVGILIMLSLIVDVIVCSKKIFFTATENDD